MLFVSVAGCGGNSASTAQSSKASKPKFTVAWSIYVGWMPWPYAAESGILKKWADKYNVEINLVQMDYIPSVEAYVAGKVDGVSMTNMEALNMAAAAGVDTTAIIVGDYSNGNDAVITRNGLSLPNLKGKAVNLVQYSVSHYLLARGLELEGKGLKEKDLQLVNTSDSDIGPVFVSNSSQEAVVTWNPIVLEILDQVPNAKSVFDSSKIPYEILDIMFLRTDVAERRPELAKALTGAWYETLALMAGKNADSQKALTAMAEKSGTKLASYEAQLRTTFMFWKPLDAANFARTKKLPEVMDLVRKFSYEQGLWQDAKSIDSVGIIFPDGTVLGNSKNVKLRFTDIYMQLAADGKL